MKKILVAATVAALAAALAPAADAGATSARTPTPARLSAVPSSPLQKGDDYQPPPLQFGPCSSAALIAAGAQCAYLVVPMDYSRPKGPTIKIAISRISHKTADSAYQGVMVVNPGGPGGSGLGLSRLQSRVPNGAGNAYDWIGFDPRGVGSSVPSLSCDANYAHGDRDPYRPATREARRQLLVSIRSYARACGATPSSELFRNLRTDDSVADLESLRKALGQEQLNYYGFSYGTYLGQVYATQHPTRVRRMVWDGVVDATRAFYESNQDQDVAFQRTFGIFTDWVSRYDDVYHLGASGGAVRKVYFDTVEKLDREAEAGVLGGDEFTDVITQAAYYVYGWQDIASAFSRYVNDSDPSGLIALYGNTAGTPGADNGYAVYLGTSCTDAPWPDDQNRIDADNTRLYDAGSTFLTWSNAWFNGPCAAWQFPKRKRAAVDGSTITAPILMVNETLDAATPFSGALQARQLFPSSALVEGVGGSTHAGTLQGTDPCEDQTVAQFLSTGALPARGAGQVSDKKCPPTPQPVPTGVTSPARRESVRSSDPSRAAVSDLRRLLAQAQSAGR